MTYSEDAGDNWIVLDPFSYIKLYEAGYSIGGYQDDEGKKRYVLYRVNHDEFSKVHDFETLQDLQLMAKLLVNGGM